MAVLALIAGACADSEDDAQLARPTPSTTVAPLPSTTSVTSTTTPEPFPSSATSPTATPVVIGPDGLGVVDFGDEADHVMAELTRVLGQPSDDRPLGSCPTGEVERLVEFAELAVSFADQDGVSRLVAWDLGPPSGALPPLTTAEGVGVGTTVAELRAAYGGRLDVRADPFGPGFEVRVDPPGRLGGTLTGAGATDTVATLAGGVATCAE